jgi:hypothetical protein
MTALASMTKAAATDREHFLSDFYAISSRAVHPTSGPYAYVVSPEQVDPGMTERLVKTLFDAGVEVQQATATFQAGGKQYPAGSYIIALDQPFRAFAKTVLERQHYPDIREYPGGPPQRPYDVTATSLPLFYNVQADAVQEKFAAQASLLTAIAPVTGHVPPASAKGYLLDARRNSSYYALFALLNEGVKAYRLTGSHADPGTIYIPEQGGVGPKLAAVARKFSADIQPATERASGDALEVKAPRVGLYKSWIASLDEGWTRFVFEKSDVPYKTLVDADIRKGNLRKRFDTIILPDNTARAILEGRTREGRDEANRLEQPEVPPEYRGGLGADGAAALKAFVENGGTIITSNKAAEVYATKDNPAFSNALRAVPSKEFYCPGSILEIALDRSSPIAFGSAATVPVFFETGPTFKISGAGKPVGRYTSDNPLLSGWILGGKYLNGTAAIADVPVGKGRIVSFGFIPTYRGLSEVTYKLLFNAMLYSTSKPTSLKGR